MRKYPFWKLAVGSSWYALISRGSKLENFSHDNEVHWTQCFKSKRIPLYSAFCIFYISSIPTNNESWKAKSRCRHRELLAWGCGAGCKKPLNLILRFGWFLGGQMLGVFIRLTDNHLGWDQKANSHPRQNAIFKWPFKQLRPYPRRQDSAMTIPICRLLCRTRGCEVLFLKRSPWAIRRLV